MKKILNSLVISTIVMSLVFIVIGIIFLSEPGISLLMISYIIAGLLIIGGIYLMATGYKKVMGITLFDGFTPGIISLVLGVVVLCKPLTLIVLIPIIIGLWFVINSTFKVKISFNMKEAKITIWWVVLVFAIMGIICGVLMILNPVIGALTVMEVVGILMIVYSSIDIIEIMLFKRNIDKLEKVFK
ncbi:MAG: DUF308 domain-containing protein [bacterium]|nr:DUF308 domain-containing protein [bacterium]